MGLTYFCCAEPRQNQNEDQESIEETFEQEKTTEIQKSQSYSELFFSPILNIRTIKFRNQDSSFSIYEEVGEKYNLSSNNYQNQAIQLYYNTVFNQILQLNFTKLTIQQKGSPKSLGETQLHYLEKLNHPFLATFVEYFENQNQIQIILNEMPTQTLQNLIKKQIKFQEEQVRQLAYQLMLVAQYFQKKKLVFFGFTPDNIFIQDEINFKSIKLGRFTEIIPWKKIQESNLENLLINKKYYFSYEIQNNSHFINNSTDLFAIGVILLEMILGSHPLQIDNQ